MTEGLSKAELRELVKTLEDERDDYRERWISSVLALSQKAVAAIESLYESLNEANARIIEVGAHAQRMAVNNGTLRGQLATAEWERDKALRRIQGLERALKHKGLKIVEGDFILRSGRKSDFILSVADPRRMLAVGIAVLEEPS